MSGIQNLDQLLGRDHPDIKYLRQDHIALVLSKALSETYLEQPNDPVQFFAKYLLNHVNQQKVSAESSEKAKSVAVKCVEFQQAQEKIKAEKEEAELVAQQVQQKKSSFFTDLEKSDDMNDKLQHLCDFLKDHTKATGCYIGYLQYPEVEIDDDAMDTDHLNMEVPKVIKFTHATDDHKYIVGRSLGEDQGITHDVFKEHSQPEAEQEGEIPDEEGEPAKAEEDILTSFKHVYVNEVVRESRMHFQRVPRLGAYMAVPLVYEHCLTDQALDAAVEDFQGVSAANEAINKEKALYMEDLENRKQEALRNGEPWEEEDKEFPVEEVKAFIATEEKLVVCLDTLGQDRAFSDEQRRFVLNTIKKYKHIWETEQQDNLTRDRDERLALVRGETIDQGDEEGEVKPDVMVELERSIDEVLAVQDEGAEQLDDEKKDGLAKQLRLNKIGELFTGNEDWKAELQKLYSMRVLKMPKILQALMYLLGFTREQLCQPKSQLFFWKTAKNLIKDEVPEKMKAYKVLGAKEGVFKLYQKVNYCEKIIAGNEIELVEQHNITFGKLYKWLQLAINTRKTDIIYRKAHSKRAREHRDKCEEQASERKESRVKYIEDAQEQFNNDHAADFEAYENWVTEQKKKADDEYGSESENEENEVKEAPVKPEFDPKEHEEKFDEDNPDIEIPPQVPVEKDNDWDLGEEEELHLIDQYWQSKE